MFEITKTILGSCTVSDGTLVTLRVAINNILETPGPRYPTGLTLGLNTGVTVSVDSPQRLKDAVVDKPQYEEDEHIFEDRKIWEFMTYKDVRVAFEEATYRGTDGLLYRASIEIEPTVVSRSMAYKGDDLGNPTYFVRWADKTSIRVTT